MVQLPRWPHASPGTAWKNLAGPTFSKRLSQGLVKSPCLLGHGFIRCFLSITIPENRSLESQEMNRYLETAIFRGRFLLVLGRAYIFFWSCFKFWIAIPYGTFFQRHSSNTEVFAWKTSRTIKVRWNFTQKKPHLGWNRLIGPHLILPTWNAGSCIVVHSQAVFISPLLLIWHVSLKLCVCV